MNTLRLLDIHGSLPMPELLETLSTGCPKRQAMQRGQIADVCGIHAPELARALKSGLRPACFFLLCLPVSEPP